MSTKSKPLLQKQTMFITPIHKYLKKSLKSQTSTRKTQTSKVNGAIFADDTDTALPNADKNNKTIKINHKIIKNQSTQKRIKIYPTKIFIVIIVQENHFQITQITLDNNHPIIRLIENDHQTKKIHETSHKIDIIDETVETISIELSIQDQIQTDLNFCLIPVPIQILEKRYHSVD